MDYAYTVGSSSAGFEIKYEDLKQFFVCASAPVDMLSPAPVEEEEE
ncbi:MAG: hypothetical protein LBE91_20330 [Tannerella sp.]|jgi:hypothetical protein|nr:hypothetical protein [Tannerella sp.]